MANIRWIVKSKQEPLGILSVKTDGTTMDDICRLCMSNIQCDKLKIPIFQEQSPEFVHILVTLLDFHIYVDDGLPSHICVRCSETAMEAHKFKKKCIESNDLLRERLHSENESLLLPNEQNDDSSHEYDPLDDCKMREAEDIEIEEIDIVKKECELCKLYFSCEADYIEHEETTHAFEQIKIDYALLCSICDYKTNSKRDFDAHNRNNHSKSWQCIICDYRTRFKSKRIKHRKTHTEENPFGCKVCPTKFKKFKYLQQHMMAHSQERPFQCQVCHSKFKKLPDLTRHMVTHSQDRPFECNVCQIKFKVLLHLKRHMLRHSQKRPFQCQVCYCKFKELADLKKHMVMHSQVCPFQCKVCLRKFKRSGNLKEHMLTHSKTFTCDICLFTTKNKRILTNHINAHEE